MVEHKYAQVLRWIADGEKIQWQDSVGKWFEQPNAATLNEIVSDAYGVGRYRLAPRAVTIAGREIEAPLRAAPEDGSKYWIPGAFGVDETSWNSGTLDYKALADGRVFATEEAARAAYDAITSLLAPEATQ